MTFFARVKRWPLVQFVYQLPFLLRPYHYCMAFCAAAYYGFPSRHMTVIGVTGTKGKTTTSHLIYQLLTHSGRKTGLATSVLFAIGAREWVNDTKQTMLGRFALQKLLKEMFQAGCRYAVIETSSEGILQYRHRFIDYDMAVFTNISPEHIERHGGFERYRHEKTKLFTQVARKKNGIGVFNLNDKSVEYFLKPGIARKIGYVHEDKHRVEELARTYGVGTIHEITKVALAMNQSHFSFDGHAVRSPLIGEFNVHNTAAALSVLLALGIPIGEAVAGVRSARAVPGRFEVVDLGQPFTIVVDYAHEPASLEAVYRAAKLFHPRRLIGLLGAQGGGRDKWKRAAMGKIAARYCDEIVLANEDPYDEDPRAIMADIKSGIHEEAKDFRPVYMIPDRREAILKALMLASRGDAVVLTGKGGEVWMCLEGDHKVRWNERDVVEDLLREHESHFLTRSGRNVRYAPDANTP